MEKLSHHFSNFQHNFTALKVFFVFKVHLNFENYDAHKSPRDLFIFENSDFSKVFRLSDNSIGSPFKPPDVPGEEVEKVWVSLVVDHCRPSPLEFR